MVVVDVVAGADTPASSLESAHRCKMRRVAEVDWNQCSMEEVAREEDLHN